MQSAFTTDMMIERDMILEFLTRLRGAFPTACFVIAHDNTGDPMKAFHYEQLWSDNDTYAKFRLLQENRFTRYNPGCADLGSRYTAHLDPRAPTVPGLTITHSEKEKMAILADMMLQQKKFYIAPRERFITNHEVSPVKADGVKPVYVPSVASPQAYNACVAKMKAQMKDFSREVKNAKDADQKIHSAVKMALSGKRWGPDDVAVCIQMCNSISMHYACGRDDHFNRQFGSMAQLCETPFRVLSDVY